MSDKSHTVKIVIKRNGTIAGTVEGIAGSDCAGILDALLAGLGTVDEHGHTSDFDATSLHSDVSPHVSSDG